LPEHVAKQLPETDYLLEAGRCSVGIESTVLSVQNLRYSILRPGAVTKDEIREAVPGCIFDEPGEQSLKMNSPGLMKSHYSPQKPLYIINKPTTLPDNSGLISFRLPVLSENVSKLEVLSPHGDLNEAAVNLFAALHRLEESDVSAIYAEALPETGIGAAIMDRLKKAAYKYQIQNTINEKIL
jgi:L-threonylcarbamoyladenylate synthase